MPTCIVIIQENKSIINLSETNKCVFLKDSMYICYQLQWVGIGYCKYLVLRIIFRDFQFEFLQYRTILCVYIRLEWRNALVLLQTPPASLRGRRKWREPNKEMLLWRKPPFIKKKKINKHVIYIIYMPFYASTKKNK